MAPVAKVQGHMPSPPNPAALPRMWAEPPCPNRHPTDTQVRISLAPPGSRNAPQGALSPPRRDGPKHHQALAAQPARDANPPPPE